MKLVIGNDHAAVEMKWQIKDYLEAKGIEVINVGTDEEGHFDYPVAACRAAKMVASGEADGGVLICGTGVGIGIAANKVKGIRCCICSDPCTARLSKEHNNANMIAFGARIVGLETAKMIVDEWLRAEAQSGRHAERVALITELEQTQRLASRGE